MLICEATKVGYADKGCWGLSTSAASDDRDWAKLFDMIESQNLLRLASSFSALRFLAALVLPLSFLGFCDFGSTPLAMGQETTM